MPEDATIFDPSRPELTRHEYLSTNPTLPAPLALVSAPQTTLIVTTLTDVVDATDGVLSLREAITLANETPGLDGITFADNLRGGTIDLTGGPLLITDHLLIDGDSQDGGSDGIFINGSGETGGDRLGAFAVAPEVSGRFEDLSIAGFMFSITGRDADLQVIRADIRDMASEGPSPGRAIDVRGGTLSVDESVIGYSASPEAPTGIYLSEGADVTVDRSTIAGLTGGFGYGIQGEGRVRVTDTTIADNGLTFGFGISIEGDLLIESSTFARNGTVDGIAGGAVRIDGSLVIVNSTIADTATGATDGLTRTGAVTVLDGSYASIVNSTITGSALGFTDGSPAARNTYGPGTGIYAAPTSVVEIRNSIIDDSVFGTITSNGANTFRELQVAGATGDDRLGVSAEQIFALTKAVPPPFVPGVEFIAGVLDDNGGPTLTVALLDDAANPSVDAADPRFAPAFDQRGFVRDAAPDIGAFELGAGPLAPPPPLPPLAEKVPLADADILPVPPGQLVLGAAADAAIGFVDEVAALQNSLGVYLIGPAGELAGPRWVFERIEHAEPSDDASEQSRPGGGPLAAGDAVLLSDLFDPAELLPGTAFGLFLAVDAWSLNPAAVFEGGTLEFRADGGPASLFDLVPALFHVSESGVERLVAGDIMHTLDPSFFEPLANPLNPGGGAQVTSGLLDGLFAVAFEDKPLAQSDRDFNDAIFAVDLLDAGDDLFAVAATATAGAPAMPAGDADLETLLVTAEAV